MPGKCELTWQPGTGGRQGRWKKKYKGRTLYLGSASSKIDLAACREALAGEEGRNRCRRSGQPNPHQAASEEASAAAARLKLANLRQRLDQKAPPPLAWQDRFLELFEFLPRDVLLSVCTNLPGAVPAVEPTHHADRPSIIDPSRFASEMDGSP